MEDVKRLGEEIRRMEKEVISEMESEVESGVEKIRGVMEVVE